MRVAFYFIIDRHQCKRLQDVRKSLYVSLDSARLL